MEEKRKPKRNKYVIPGIVLVFIAVGLGIFGYIKVLKKSTAQLMEIVPQDAAYVIQINNNDEFVKSISSCKSYLNDVFVLDALSGFEYFIDLTKGDLSDAQRLVISGHGNADNFSLLMSIKMDEKTFSKLLKRLQINPKDYSKFEHYKMYDIGTHYKKFVIVQHDGVFSASDNKELLQNSIRTFNSSKSILKSDGFDEIDQLLQKNNRQNWIVIHHERWMGFHLPKINETFRDSFAAVGNLASWSAYQVRFTDNEVSFSGYSLMTKNSFFQRFVSQSGNHGDLPESILPAQLNYYVSLQIPDLAQYSQTSTSAEKADLLKLNCQESYCFSTTYNDTTLYNYVAVKGDTSQSFIVSILPEGHTLDSAVSYKNFKIYASGVPHFTNALSSIHQEVTPNYFTDYQGYYIFSDSIEPLKAYIDNCLNGQFIEQNQYYLFSKNNLPSDNRFQLFFQNQNKYLDHYLSSQFLQTQSGLENLRVFSYTFSQPIGNLVPNIIYLKFATN